MSTRTQTCVIVTCDCCDEDLQGYEEQFTVHFDDIPTALAELVHYDWLVETGTWWQRIRRFFLALLPAKRVRLDPDQYRYRYMCIACELFQCESCEDAEQGWGCCCGRERPEDDLDPDDDAWDEYQSLYTIPMSKGSEGVDA